MIRPSLLAAFSEEMQKDAVDLGSIYEGARNLYHLSEAHPELMMLGAAKAHFFGRYGHRIPGLKQVFKPVYQSALHAGMHGGVAGEKGLHEVTKGLMSLADPHLVDTYEKGQQVGRAVARTGVKTINPNIVDKALQHASAADTSGLVGPAIAEYRQSIVDAAEGGPLGRVARALTGKPEDVRSHLYGGYLGKKVPLRESERPLSLLGNISSAKVRVPAHRAATPLAHPASNVIKAASALRSRVSVLKVPKGYQLHLAGEPIGHMVMSRLDPSAVSLVHIDPKYRGLGLGKKFYGEVAKKLPGGTIKSDSLVSEEAQRVWRGMEKRKYNVTEDLLSTNVPGFLRINPKEDAKPVVFQRALLARPAFTATLPAKAGAPPPKALSTVDSILEGIGQLGHVTPQTASKPLEVARQHLGEIGSQGYGGALRLARALAAKASR